ncbi:MAG: hypothetical protein KatS3mg082_3003 [Nitrospiraceae bacterium]|nr:MAG: hypothetical protein KatS3mg082_3003 [Nitrospiraceae bacterium]
MVSPVGFFLAFNLVDVFIFLLVTGQPVHIPPLFTAMPWHRLGEVRWRVLLIYGFVMLAASVVSMDLRRPRDHVGRRIPLQGRRWLTLSLVAAGLSLELYHFAELDKTVLWSGSDYLLLSNPVTAGIQSAAGRIAHFLLRPLGLLTAALATASFVERRRVEGTLLLLATLYPFLIVWAQNSRWAPLYLFAALLVLVVSSAGRALAWKILLVVLTFLTLAKVLIGRGIPAQGLAATREALQVVVSSASPEFVAGFVLNVFQGAQNVANTLLLEPEYPAVYKLLSFAPTVSAVDSFETYRQFYELRITQYVPINAYAEAWAFGPLYFALLLLILCCWLRAATRVAIAARGWLPLAVMIASYWLTFTLSQYSLRTSLRFVYAVTFVGFLWAYRRWLARSQRRIKVPQRRLPRLAQYPSP